MKFPKFILSLSCQGRRGGFQREPVASYRKAFEDQLYVVGIFLEQLLKLRHQPRTVASLEVAEHNDGDRCIRRAFNRRTLGIDLLDKVQGENFH